MAAATLLDESGDARSLTLRGIARRAGITAPSIYPHFADLPSLIDALLARSFQDLESDVAAALCREDDPTRALIAAGLAYVRFGWAHPARYRLMFAAGGYAPDAVVTFSLVELAIQRCQEVGAAPRSDVHIDAWLLWAALHGVATLEKPARSDYLRLGPLDRPAMLALLIRRVVGLPAADGAEHA